MAVEISGIGDQDCDDSGRLEQFGFIWSNRSGKNGNRKAHSFVLKQPGGHFSHSNDLQRG